MRKKQMMYDIGIPAYNEEKNIENVLNSIINQETNENYKLKSIIIVSSGSTDRTNEIIEEIAKKKPFVKLIIEEERRGQVSAYNLILKYATADVVVLMDADIILYKNSIIELLKMFSNENVAAVGSRPLPILYDDHFMNNISMIFYLFHNLFPIIFQAKLSGKFFALRNGIVKKIPKNVNCSDAFIEIMVRTKNYSIKYSKIAKALTIPPQTITGFIKEQRRIYAGHLQLRNITGQMVKTANFSYLLRLVVKSFRYFINKRKIHFLLFFLFLKIISTGLSFYDQIRGNYRTIWEIIEDTKEVRIKK